MQPTSGSIIRLDHVAYGCKPNYYTPYYGRLNLYVASIMREWGKQLEQPVTYVIKPHFYTTDEMTRVNA